MSTCEYIYKQGKNSGERCVTKRLYNNSKYCKQHYNRLFPDTDIKKQPKIQEINSEGEPVNSEVSSVKSASSGKRKVRSKVTVDENGVDIITIKSKREVMLDLEHILKHYKEAARSDDQIVKTKTKTKSKPREKIPEDTSQEYVEENGISVPFREKTVYVDVLQSTANICLFPSTELLINKFTPLDVTGLSEEVKNCPEAQEALVEVIEEMVPESTREADPVIKFITIIGGLVVKTHLTNMTKKANRIQEQQSVLVTEDISEKYKDL